MVSDDIRPFEEPEEATTTLGLHFGEIAVLESSLKMYEEMIFPEHIALTTMERKVTPIKTLLLKLGSAYVETVDNHQEIDHSVQVTFTESELWTLRGGVNIAATFNGVPIGLTLKAKLYSALIEVSSGVGGLEIGDLIESGNILDDGNKI